MAAAYFWSVSPLKGDEYGNSTHFNDRICDHRRHFRSYHKLGTFHTKKNIRENLARLSFDELQRNARELWQRGNALDKVFAFNPSFSTMYGTEGEALFELLMETTFLQKDDFNKRYPFLVTHYTWLLQLLMRYLEANWSWSDTSASHTLSRSQLSYRDSETSELRYPQARNDLAALKLGGTGTLDWLRRNAERQATFLEQTGKSRSIPIWNAELFKSEQHTVTVPPLSIPPSIQVIHCHPELLQKEIQRLSTKPDSQG